MWQQLRAAHEVGGGFGAYLSGGGSLLAAEIYFVNSGRLLTQDEFCNIIKSNSYLGHNRDYHRLAGDSPVFRVFGEAKESSGKSRGVVHVLTICGHAAGQVPAAIAGIFLRRALRNSGLWHGRFPEACGGGGLL